MILFSLSKTLSTVKAVLSSFQEIHQGFTTFGIYCPTLYSQFPFLNTAMSVVNGSIKREQENLNNDLKDSKIHRTRRFFMNCCSGKDQAKKKKKKKY